MATLQEITGITERESADMLAEALNQFETELRSAVTGATLITWITA